MTEILEIEALKKALNRWRLKGEKIVFTNGCFDILHTGHLKILAEAKKQGTKLIVAVNTDSSIKQLKGKNRPIKNEEERALIIASLKTVDAVILFEEETPLKLIETIEPDVLVKGGDYKENEIVGASFVKKNGGEVIIIPLVEGKSSTNLINRLKN